MQRWTCPDCGRRFGRTRQGHECAPALTIEQYFESGPTHERPVYEAVQEIMDSIGDVYVEPVSVGIFFKRSRVFAQLRPMQKWVALGFIHPRKLDDQRIARKVVDVGKGYYHVVNVRTPDEIDETIRDWLTEAYLADS